MHIIIMIIMMIIILIVIVVIIRRRFFPTATTKLRQKCVAVSPVGNHSVRKMGDIAYPKTKPLAATK